MREIKSKSILTKNNVNYIDPKNYMSKILDQYALEQNPVRSFFDLDSNHPNQIGSRLIGEYLATNLIPFLKE